MSPTSWTRSLFALDARVGGPTVQSLHPLSPLEELEHRAVELVALVVIPGVARRDAEGFLAEVGVDMSRFPSDRHIASWARLCPGTNESAGRRGSGFTGHGNPWLRGALVEMAHGAARTKRSYLSAQYHRIAARRGAKRASVAVAHSILVIGYHLLRRGTPYQDLGTGYFDQRNREAVVRPSVRRLEALGYRVNVVPAA